MVCMSKKKVETPPEWEKLAPYDQARQCAEMWLGSRDPHKQIVLVYGDKGPTPKEITWVPAVFTAFREVFDNALDEVAAHGNGDRIDVTYNEKTRVISIKDNGRGVPIEYVAKEKKHAATILLSEQFAGRNFSKDRGETRGMNGVGAAIVNFTSEYYQVDIKRDKKSFSQRFEEGTEHKVHEPILAPDSNRETGTKIEFRLSKKVFHATQLPDEFIHGRMVEAALCYPDLKLFYNGKLVRTKGVEKTLFPNAKPITVSITGEGFKGDFWLIPGFFADGEEHAHSLVNAIPMFSGGVHIETFKRTFFSGMLSALETMSKRKGLTPNRSDLSDGMLIYNITQMKAPKFDGQSKTRLNNENVSKIIASELASPDFFKGLIKKNPEWIEEVYRRCAERTQKRDNAEISKLAKKAGKVRVAKLRDATSVDRMKCSLYITEGDSALGGLTQARNATIHGAIPLQGKVMNVRGLTPKQIYANEELASVMNSIGLVAGQRANIRALRYGRIYITTDADEDGKSICGLLTNFFYLNWPELFDPANPVVHVFDTPLIIAAKGKQRKYWYADDVHGFVPDTYRGWEITRAKGLAQLKKVDWEHALTNPKSFPLIDDGDLSEALSLIFDTKRADDRKNWISM